jgi:uroporphyrinogen decarboxylase
MSKLIDALHCKNQAEPPIWLMRQAGRYLPTYRKLKEGKSLFGMFHDTEIIVQTTLLPFEYLHLDAAILFSDILTVLDGLHIRYDFHEGTGPIVLDSPGSIQRIEPSEAYTAVGEAIKILKKELKIPLLGFAGAPFTVASYLIEGKTSRDLRKTKQWMFREPESFFKLISKITQATIEYLYFQIDAGVDAVQIFDSWANALAIAEFRQASLKPMHAIVDAVKKRNIPVIVFTKGSSLFVDELNSLVPSAISLDWSGDLPRLRKKIPSSIAVQGNLDPMVLYAPREAIRDKIDYLLTHMFNDPGYIFNLGHGILPDTPLEHVQFMVDYVRAQSGSFAQAQ